MIRFIVSLFSLCISTASLAQIQVPNDFVAGTPARAAEVNANFDALEGAIDQNVNAIASNEAEIAVLADRGGIMVYAGNTELGRFVDLGGLGGVVVLSPQGFLFTVGITPADQADGYLMPNSPVYFSDVNCTGDAYVVLNRAAITLGSVYKVRGGAAVSSAFYTLKGQKVVQNNVPIQSTANVDQCVNAAETVNGVTLTYPNDPAVTGVSDTPPTEWLTLGQP